jgi:hypothetical protein
MIVSVDEAGDDGRASQVYDLGLGAGSTSDFHFGADRRDVAVAHQHGFGDGVASINGPDDRVD